MVCCKNRITPFWMPPKENWFERPWGGYINHFTSDDKTVCYKTLMVKHGEQISVQYHNKRSEVWWIPDENSNYELTLDNIKQIYMGERRINVPVGMIHSIKNLSVKPLIIYEMQYGICEESDIVRLYDPYNRQTTT